MRHFGQTNAKKTKKNRNKIAYKNLKQKKCLVFNANIWNNNLYILASPFYTGGSQVDQNSIGFS
jgi:hypothetical protein